MATTTQQLPRSFSLENIRTFVFFDRLGKSARVYHKAQERRGQQALHRQVEWAKGVVLAVPPGSRTKR